jgi:hypothetical protein
MMGWIVCYVQCRWWKNGLLLLEDKASNDSVFGAGVYIYSWYSMPEVIMNGDNGVDLDGDNINFSLAEEATGRSESRSDMQERQRKTTARICSKRL